MGKIIITSLIVAITMLFSINVEAGTKDIPSSVFEDLANDLVELQGTLDESTKPEWQKAIYTAWVNNSKFNVVKIYSITRDLLVLITENGRFIVVPLNSENRVILLENK